MIATPFLLPLMFMAAGADSGSTRQAYAGCIHALMKPALQEKTTPEAFTTQVKTACATQEKAFREAIISEDKADGMPAAAAKSDANDQVTEMQNSNLETYKYHLSSNTLPS